MILKAYSVYDSKAGVYAQPVFYRNDGEAIRAFSNAANLPEHPFCANAEDFTLFEIGDYDDITGNMAALTTPQPLRKAIQLKGTSSDG